jgi:uncharacterized protein (DUF488 family)
MPKVNRLKLPATSAKQQIERKIAWNDGRTVEAADFFTVGYSGRTTEELIDVLRAGGVRTLLDVRQTPVSIFRPEMSKSNLRELVESHGMLYAHMPELGVPRDIRAKAIETGSREAIWQWYDEYVVEPYLGTNLHHFLNSVEHPVAMMCVELDPHECHRHRLFLALEQKGLRGFDL